MYSTPSKLVEVKRGQVPHLIVNQGGSASEEEENILMSSSGRLGSDSGEMEGDSDGSGGDLDIPRFHFGANTSEMKIEMQTQIVNAFHKVLSVLRQNRPEDMAEPIKTNLANFPSPIVPLLEQLTYFLEQYRFTPTLLFQNIEGLSRPHGLGSAKLVNSEISSSSAYGPSSPTYDYESMSMIMAESKSFGMALKLGMSEIEWLSAVESLNGVVLSWLKNLYRIPSHLIASFIDDLQMTRQKILLAAIRTHFPSHTTEGYRAFLKSEKRPVILCTHLVPWVSLLVSDLGLPLDSIRVGPESLYNLSPNDTVVAVFWVLPDPTDPITWNESQTDSLLNFVLSSGIWMHAEGYDTILMSSLSDPSSNIVAQIADSLIVDASELLQIDRLSNPIIFSRSSPRHPSSSSSPSSPSSIIQFNPSSPLTSYPETSPIPSNSSSLKNQDSLPLSQNTPFDPQSTSKSEATSPILLSFSSQQLHLDLWFAIQLKGYHFISTLVNASSHLCDLLYRRIGMSPSFRILESADKSNTKLHIRYEFPKASHVTGLGSSKVVLSGNVGELNQKEEKKDGDLEGGLKGEKGDILENNLSLSSEDSKGRLEVEDEKVTEYLFGYMKNGSQVPMPMELERLRADGKLYLVWNPLRSFNPHLISSSLIHSFSDTLLQQSAIITSTLECRQVLEREIKKISSLALVVPNPIDHVGLGAIRYLPEFVSSLEDEFGKQAQRWAPIVDELNRSIFNELLQIHPLYYLCSSQQGHISIGLHLDSSEMTPDKVAYHVQLISETALRIESDSQFLDQIGDIVKEGIKEAQQAIQRSNTERASQKGVVRSIPLVGSVWNWWSPIKPVQSQGTSFDLISQTQSSQSNGGAKDL